LHDLGSFADCGALPVYNLRDPQVYGTAAVFALFAAGAGVWLMLRKRPTADDLERMRREELVRMGRLIDGTVLDVSDLTEEESGRKGGMQLILYKYEIAGVVYECSQDVSTLSEYLDIHQMRLGFPCSVRYDTHRPTNSIVVAETWSGLRDIASGVPVRRGIPPQRTPRTTTSA